MPAPVPGMTSGLPITSDPKEIERLNRAREWLKTYQKGLQNYHYLTTTAKEYVPDTDQMTFKIGFGGLGIKKVYNCPLRRRPVFRSSPKLPRRHSRCHHLMDEISAHTT